jgi:hypothetical protein
MAQFLKIAKLSDEDVDTLRELETELGKHIMAFTPGLELADLSPEQLEQVQTLEETLDAYLIVYED